MTMMKIPVSTYTLRIRQISSANSLRELEYIYSKGREDYRDGKITPSELFWVEYYYKAKVRLL